MWGRDNKREEGRKEEVCVFELCVTVKQSTRLLACWACFTYPCLNASTASRSCYRLQLAAHRTQTTDWRRNEPTDGSTRDLQYWHRSCAPKWTVKLHGGRSHKSAISFIFRSQNLINSSLPLPTASECVYLFAFLYLVVRLFVCFLVRFLCDCASLSISQFHLQPHFSLSF